METNAIYRNSDGTVHTSNIGGLDIRFEGITSKIIRLDHAGWYTDRFRDDTTQGVVYRLPSNRGFLAGYTDPWNACEDGTGPCNLELCAYATKEEAARRADRMAERFAEKCREESLKNAAQVMMEEAELLADDSREEIRRLVSEIRSSASLPPTICSVLRRNIAQCRREYLNALRKAREAVSEPWMLEA